MCSVGATPLHEDADSTPRVGVQNTRTRPGPVLQLGTGVEKELRHGAAAWTEGGAALTSLTCLLVPETRGARGGGQPLLSHSMMARV